MARTKYTSNFCGYCNKSTRMEIVGEMEGVQDKIWYRCTRCHHMALIDLKAQAEGAAATKLDAASATPYNPELRFNIGDAIFHSEWNDVGRVLSTTRTSSGGESILVQFEKQGQRRLIANLKAEASSLV